MKYNGIEYSSGDIVGDYNIRFIEEVQSENSQRKAKFICPLCQKEFITGFREVKQNRTKSCGCKRKKKVPSNKIYYSKGQELGANGVVFLADIENKTGRDRRAIFKCPLCGESFEASISNVKSNKTRHCGCGSHPVKVGQRYGRLTITKLIPQLGKKCGHAIWECKCDCGNVVQVKSDNLIRGYKKSCGCLLKESHEKRKKDMRGKKFLGLTPIEPVPDMRKNGGTVWKCRCDCGNICYIRQGALGYTASCGCVVSKGENQVANILESLGVKFKRQKTFKNCINPKTNKSLRFDFYLPDYNYCIEFNGEQHYHPIQYFGGEEGLYKVQYRDNLKKKFCLDNGIIYIELAYNMSIEDMKEKIKDELRRK